MKKLVVLLMVLLMLAGQSAVATAAIDAPQVMMPDGFVIQNSFMKDDRIYLTVGDFTHLSDVIAYNDFGGTGLWSIEKDDPGKSTDVAFLELYNQLRTVIVVVNKTTGEELVEAYGNVSEVHPDLNVIIREGTVYLPLRATSEFLGATVDYDSSNNIVTIKQS